MGSIPQRQRRQTVKPSGGISAAIVASLLVGTWSLEVFFARWHLRRGRGDAKGALRMACFTSLAYAAWALSDYHFVPRPDTSGIQFLLLGIPLFFGLLAWIGYMAAEPYVRRRWPKLMVSWQRLLSGRLRDPLVGRDVLLGVFAGSVSATLFLFVAALAGLSDINRVDSFYGQGVWPSIGYSISLPASACVFALSYLALLAILTRLLRWRWLGLTTLGLIQVALFFTRQRSGPCRHRLVRARIPGCSYQNWPGGRAQLPDYFPDARLFSASGNHPVVLRPRSDSAADSTRSAGLGFYVSLGGQPIFGIALKED